MGLKSIAPKKDGAIEHVADLSGRSYVVECVAVVDGPGDGPAAIRDYLAAAGFLAGSPYRYPFDAPTETDFGSYLQRVRIRRDDPSGLRFAVTLEYGSRDVSTDGPAQGPGLANWIMAPWMARPDVRWGTTERELACMRDRDGAPILNAAGQPFDPPLTIPESVLTATVVRVEQSFDPATAIGYKDRLNDAEWYGWPAESVRCMSIESEPFTDGDWGLLHRTTYVFGFRPPVVAGSDKVFPGWAVAVLNAGKMQLVGTKLVKIYDQDMQPVTEPVPLRADGTWDVASAPVYLSFNLYKTADFEAFNFPPNLFG